MKEKVLARQRVLNWNWYEKQIHDYFPKIKNLGIKYVIGIGKGGLIPAVHLANLLDVPLGIIHYSSYEGKKKKDGLLHGSILQLEYRHQLTLLVDDIQDTGKTIEECEKFLEKEIGFKKIAKCVMIDKNDKQDLKIYKANWITFPWEW